MKARRFFSILLTFSLLFIWCTPVIALTDEEQPPQMKIITQNKQDILLEKEEEQEKPKEPQFEVIRLRGIDGYKLIGRFFDYPSETKNIKSYYSFDGTSYIAIEGDGDFWCDDTEDKNGLIDRTLVNEGDSPLKEYLAKEKDSFFIKLEYEDINGTKDFLETEIKRPTDIIPLPDDIAAVTLLPNNTKASSRPPTYQYCITAKESATKEELEALLPDKLKMQLYFSDNNLVFLDKFYLDCDVKWNLSKELSFGEVVVANAATVTLPDEGIIAEIFGHEQLYKIDTIPKVENELNLKINVVTDDEKADPLMHISESVHEEAMYIDFPLKPTGAKTITPFYSINGGETWVQAKEIISRNGALEAFPKTVGYTTLDLFTYEDSPVKEFFGGEIEGFLVKAEIEGGTFSGTSEIISWPLGFDYLPPPTDNSNSGSGGNENNAGSNDGSQGGLDNGQRPELGEPEQVEEIEAVPPEEPIQVVEIDAESTQTISTSKTPKSKETQLKENLSGQQENPSPPKDNSDNPLPADIEEVVDIPTWNMDAAPEVIAKNQPESLVPTRKSSAPPVATGVLLVGGITAVTMTAGSTGGTAAGVIKKLIKAIKAFFTKV